MKINVDQVLLNIVDDSVLMEEEKPLTLKDICLKSLLSFVPNEPPNGSESFERFLIAKKVKAGGDVELSVEEISKIKHLIGKNYSPIVVGFCYELLEKNN